MYVYCRGEISSVPPRILGRPMSVISDTDGIGELCENIKKQRFRAKARKQDVEVYMESCRTKFGCFEEEGNDIAGGSHDIVGVSHDQSHDRAHTTCRVPPSNPGEH